jgi:hypothetical protein
MTHRISFAFLILLLSAVAAFPFTASKSQRLLYLPLDERFTTRDLFINFAGLTNFSLVTPERSMLPDKKRPANLDKLIDWTRVSAATAGAAIISADMLLHGGLIGSRISSDSLSDVRKRLNAFAEIRRKNPRLPILVSSTVMRMPSYNGAEEEPDYYAKFGRDIFLFSEATHRFEVLKDPKDKKLADEIEKRIPADVLSDYLNRRNRNFAINKELIGLVKNGVISRLVITLDDNAEFGLFKKEAAELEKLSRSVSDRVAIYPGADEAQLPLLARLANKEKRLKVFVAYRFPQSAKLIPAFEGQPLELSVSKQISAVGGTITKKQNDADLILYVNNFKEKNIFPPREKAALDPSAEPLEVLLEKAGITLPTRKIVILADNNYYNGADSALISSILKTSLPPDQIAYSGWNTSGNTLGSAISLGALRHSTKMTENYKKLLFSRFIEDWAYMTAGREQIRDDLKARKLDGFSGNTELERIYEDKMKELFNSQADIFNQFLQTNFRIKRAFFPWHRSFEVCFELDR